jgi:hypothetical protein
LDEEITDARKVGIADGGRTFAVISNTMLRIDDLKKDENWTEPYVRGRFITTSKAAFVVPEEMVEALNTSTQVKEHTIDEYRNEFQPLKDIFTKAGFNIVHIAFRENDTAQWDIRDILQRLGCFLKDKQSLGPQMYKSKQKALKLYIDSKTRDDFLSLSDVMLDVAFLPEYIESQFSNKENLKTRNRFGGLRVVKPLKGGYRYPEIGYPAYWTTAANVILRVKSEMLQEKLSQPSSAGTA